MNTIMASKQVRLGHLDLFKGIAIIFVVITHYSWRDETRLRLLFPFWIDMAVPVFMIITGFVHALSYEKRGGTLESSYRLTEILSKWLRYIIPYTPVWIITVICRLLGYGRVFRFEGIIFDIFYGGDGPGSYFFTIMLQVVLLLPLIIWIVKRNPTTGIIFCFFANVIFEILKTLLNMDTGLYRICPFRYLFVLSYGCFLYFYKQQNIKHELSVIIGAVGAIYIVIFNYTNAKPVITGLWTNTSVFASLILFPIMMILLEKNSLHNKLFEMLGQASFNICLVQMVYYLIADSIAKDYIPYPPLQIAANVLICCFIGVMFHKIENPITQSVIKKIRSGLNK